MLVKKYGNRRLYDTDASRYITLEDLAEHVREGAEVRVVDAKTNADLTQETLTQIIIEGRGAERILPASLLHKLIRLRDDALADFLGRYVEGALELYLQAKKTSQTLLPFNPMLGLFGQVAPGAWSGPSPQVPPPPPAAAPTSEPAGGVTAEAVEALRRELDELRTSLRKRKK